jgi:acetyltransferase EpsM
MFLYGAGGHAKVVRDILEAGGLTLSGISDDNPELRQWMEFEVTCGLPTDEAVIICVGNAEHRKAIAERLKQRGYCFGTAIHPTAVVSPFASIGEGTVVMAGAVVNSGVRIGRHCIINSGAVVEHECVVDDYVHISPNATLCGGLAVGEGAWVGAGAVVVQGVSVGPWSIVGAGSVVLKDIPGGVVAYGNPCRVIRRLTDTNTGRYEKTY